MRLEQMLNNLMQIGLTVSLAALVPLVLRRVMKKRYPARAVCVVWALLALRLLVPVQLTLPQAPVQVMPRTNFVVSSDRTAFEQAGMPLAQTPTRWVTDEQAAALGAADAASVTTVDIAKVLLALWLVGAAACVLRQGIGYCSLTRSLKRTAKPAECADLHAVLRQQCAELHIDREIPLRVSAAADCPMLAGFVRPTLYLPDESISGTDAAFIFRHELTHYRHGDLWLKLLLVLAKCVHWFNPLVHLMARFAQEDIELACDDAVVRGQSSAYRRAYGETILRSAIAQSQRRKALVSCFGDDKKTLMRRFEGLFDKSVKKRGVALVVMIAVLVGSLGCTIAVGENDTLPTEKMRIQLAQKKANEAENLGYTVKLDGKDTYLITEGEFSDNPGETISARVVQKLSFAKQDGEWVVSNSEIVPENGRVTSLDEFKLLYENDLGLPDFLSDSNQWKLADGYRISDPTEAAEVLLGIFPAASQIEGSNAEPAPYNDIRKVTFTFADNSKVIVTMVNQFGQGWLPQDWTDGEGKSSRTAADLAQQYARAVLHKSAQYLFPVLTPDGQQDLITQQKALTGGEQWTWKYGPSSPSATDFVLVPTDDAQAYKVVFRYTNGEPDDVRSAFLIKTGSVNNRQVITGVEELSDNGRARFDTLYRTGLAFPTVPEHIDSMDTQTQRGYTDPAQAAMQYFGMALRGDSYLMLLKDTEVIYQAIGGFSNSDDNTETAVVQLTFGDSSTPVKVQMEKTASGYWQPVGVVENITAKSGEQELGIGANARGALVSGSVPPELSAGDTISFAFENEPSGGVQITDRLVKWDSTLQDAQIGEQTTLTKTADGWTYTVPALTSTEKELFLHALTLEYTDSSHIRHQAATLYAMQNGEPQTAATGEDTLDSVKYRDDALGYTLELPLSFNNTVGGSQNADGSVSFHMLDETSSSSENIGIMTLDAQPTAALRKDYGENWTENYAVPVKQLAERDGLTYFLTYASDVQYDPSNKEQAAKYKELYTAAQGITADDFTLDDRTDKDNTARRKLLLERLGEYYAAQQGMPVRVYVDAANNSCEVFFSRTDWETGVKTYAADRVTFKDVTSTEPTEVEHLEQGLTEEQFNARYGAHEAQ